MYFVTSKRPEYILFCTTPSERAAVGLTDKQVVHLLVRPTRGEAWRVLREWTVEAYSHTDFMAQLREVSEPADPRQLVDFLPTHLR
ncbi:MAG: hypothetical protein U0587_18610 [Candidatus Binatia bacterium]